MILNIENTVIDYLNKYGFLFENDSFILLEELKTVDKIKQVKLKYKKKLKQLMKHRDESLDRLKEFSKDFGMDIAKDLADEMTEKIEEQQKKIKTLYFIKKNLLKKQELEELENIAKFSNKTSALISGVGLASILIYSSYKLYKDSEKRYRRLCSNKRGIENKKCIAKYREEALKKRLTFLNNAAIKCNYSKDPIKCKDKLDEEILKIKQRLYGFTNDVYVKITGDE